MSIKFTESDIITSYEKLISRSKLDLDFVLLTVVAAIICTFGFRMNSPSVIIGAMVLSPILLTIIAIGVSLFRKEWKYLFNNLFSLLVGILSAITVSVVITLIFPIEYGSEITERLAGGMIDYFFIAIFSGFGGAFAYFWPNIIEALAGVAISVALIPPVVMVGVMIAQWDLAALIDSITIVGINVVGILIGAFLVVLFLHIYSRARTD